MTTRTRSIVGWLAVVVGAAFSCFWAFWGSIEAFHEGWYYHSLWMNLALTLAQYLAPMLAFAGVTLVATAWPRIGGILYIVGAGVAMWFFRGANWTTVYVTIVTPLVLLGLLFWFGRPKPRWLAVSLVAGLTLATMIASGAYPAWRVFTRVDDGDRGARTVSGNGVALTWAPAGPGWPTEGVTWFEAKRRCEHLSEDGRTLAKTPQYIWRLPTIAEAVASSSLHGRNCGGAWSAASGTASFPACAPDKEPPLWNPYSPVIYWWTSSAAPGDRIYRLAYNGHVMPLRPQTHWGYLGFRAVRVVRP